MVQGMGGMCYDETREALDLLTLEERRIKERYETTCKFLGRHDDGNRTVL